MILFTYHQLCTLPSRAECDTMSDALGKYGEPIVRFPTQNEYSGQNNEHCLSIIVQPGFHIFIYKVKTTLHCTAFFVVVCG